MLRRQIDPRAMSRFLFWAVVVAIASPGVAQDQPVRTQWTSSRVLGSPEPPLPYTTEPIYERIKWDRPIYAKSEPGTQWLVVVQQGGEADRPTKILRIIDSADVDEASTLLEIEGRLVYGLTFHPEYERNGELYVFSNGPTPEPTRFNRISRYKVDRDNEQSCKLDSEVVILEWHSQGHDGGELAFGADGMLYISSGDGTSDSDAWLSGQDISNLLGGVLRIDVDHPTQDRLYSIPKDNPFVGVPRARGELWAFGLRNPWRLWADRQSGQIWVGSNGQDLWETVHLIRRGENYGWSVYEGSHPFYANRERGPAPIVAPTIEHHHIEARSMTGGVVYRGKQHPELDGAYVYGDYATGKIWAARHDGQRLTWHQEIADTPHQIAGFSITPREELIVIDHGGGLHRIVKAPPQEIAHEFPRKLSETGLFVSTREHEMSPGIVPYSVNAPAWNDGATAERFMGLPGAATISHADNRGWNFPDGSVIVQTLSLAGEGSGSPHRIETRLLVKQQKEWVGYAYQWNDAQDDATLVPSEGVAIPMEHPDFEGHTWKIPSRAECMSCHSRAVNFVLGLSDVQVDLSGPDERNQISRFADLGLFGDSPPVKESDTRQLVNPYDESQTLESRVRSYLHSNCSSCHVEAGGGNARMELEATRNLDAMRVVSVRPQHSTFGIENAMLIAPGEPEKSVLYQRISRRGSGQMPPIFSTRVDRRAAETMRRWISSLPKPPLQFVRDWRVDDLSPHLASSANGRSLEAGAETFRKLGCQQCHRFAAEGGGAGPNLSTISATRNPQDLLESIIEPSAKITAGFETTVFVTTDGKAVQGRIINENGQQVTIHSNESFGKPITIAKHEIEERLQAQRSSMPTGLLNSLERDEILDLLAYLLQPDPTENKAEATGD